MRRSCKKTGRSDREKQAGKRGKRRQRMDLEEPGRGKSEEGPAARWEEPEKGRQHLKRPAGVFLFFFFFPERCGQTRLEAKVRLVAANGE